MRKKERLLHYALIVGFLLLAALPIVFQGPSIVLAEGSSAQSVYVTPPVNTTIVASTDANYAFMMNNPLAPYSTYFKNDSLTTKSVRYLRTGYIFDFDIAAAQAQWYNSATRAVSGNVANPQHTTAGTAGTVLTYANAWSGADLVYTTNETCLKEQLTIRSVPTNTSKVDFFRYRINIYYNNSLGIYVNNNYYLHPSSVSVNTTGSIEFWDGNNNTVLYIPPPFVFDGAGHRGNATFFLSLNNGIDLWYLGVPKSFLDSATYPVYLDPSVVASSDSANSVYNPHEKKAWATPLKHWTTWANTTDWLYSSSSDGTTWSSASTLRDENNTNPSDGISTRYFTSVGRGSAWWLSTDSGSSAGSQSFGAASSVTSYVNSFDSTHTQWNVTGASPYLQSGDSEYISILNTGSVTEGHFNFSGFVGTGTLSSVILYLRGKSTVGDDSVQVSLYNGTAWSSTFYMTGFTTTSWSDCFSKDITGYYSSTGWSQLNLTQIQVSGSMGLGDTLYISSARIVVAYTPYSVDFAIKAWQVNYLGSAYDLGSASSYYNIVTPSVGYTGYLSNNSWSPTVPANPGWNYTDSIKVTIYGRSPAGNNSGTGSWSALGSTFMTSPLDTSTFVSSAWNATYYVDVGSVVARFRYGNSTYGSKIENFQITYAAYHGVGGCIHYDGTYVHFAMIKCTLTGTGSPYWYTYYKRGTCSDVTGKITWSTYEQTALGPGSSPQTASFFPMTVTVDTNGYPWVAARWTNSTSSYMIVSTSSTKDGTWVTATNFPKILPYTTAWLSSTVTVVALTSGRVYVVGVVTSYGIDGYLYNGTWQAKEVIASGALANPQGASVTVNGDDVCVAWLNNTYYILYEQRDFATSTWSAAETASPLLSSTNYPVISYDGLGSVYCFWGNNSGATSKICYNKRTAPSTWGATVTWQSSTSLQTNYSITCFLQAYSYMIGVEWLTVSPYNVTYAFILLNSPPTNDACSVTNLDSSTILAKMRYYTWSVYVSDPDGVSDLTTVDLNLSSASGTYAYACRWTEDTNAWSVLGTSNGTYLWLGTSTNVTSGTQAQLTFYVMFGWNYPMTSVNATVVSADLASHTTTTAYLTNYPMVKTIQTTPTPYDTRMNIGATDYVSGTVQYVGTSTAAPDAEISSVIVHDSSHTSKGSQSSVAAYNASFTLLLTVANNQYHINVQGTDGNFPNGDVSGATFNVVSDSLTITISGPSVSRISINANATGISATAKYDYDGAGFGGTLTWNSSTFTYATAQIQGYTVSSASGDSYGITTIRSTNPNATSEIWDSVTITISGPSASEINVNANATGIAATGKFDYDGATYDGTFTWNSSTFTYATAQKQSYTVNSISGGSYPSVTAIRSTNPNSTSEIWNSVTITLSGPADTRINVNANASGLSASGIYDYNGTSFDGTFNWNDTTFTHATAGIWHFTVSSVSGGTHGITAIRSTNPNSTSEIWDYLQLTLVANTTNPKSGEYVSVNVSAVYAYDSTAVSTLSVNILRNGTHFASANFTAAGSAVTYQYTTENASDVTHGITEFQSNTVTIIWDPPIFWILTAVDVDGNTLTNTVISITGGGVTIYWNTTNPWTQEVTSNTYNVSVTWLQDLLVNQTLNVNIAANTTTSLTCLCYPYTISGTRYWIASNSTITSTSTTSVSISANLTSSTSPSDYVLVASCTSTPVYILGVAYDKTTCLNPYGYLVLNSTSASTITIGYAAWGGVYITMTDHALESAGITTAGDLSISLRGSVGDFGHIKIDCGSRGNPWDTGNMTTTYTGTTLTGTYLFYVDPTSFLIRWYSTSPHVDGGVSNTPSNLIVNVALGFPAIARPSSTVNGTLHVVWSGYQSIYLWSVEINSGYGNWSLNTQSLPLELLGMGHTGATGLDGDVSLPVTLNVPSDISAGTSRIPCMVTVQTTGGNAKAILACITLDIAGAAVQVPYLMTYLFVLLLGGAVVTMPLFIQTKRKRRRQRG